MSRITFLKAGRVEVADRLRLLYVCSSGDSAESLPEELRTSADVTTVHNPLRALAKIAREKFDGVYVAGRPSAKRRAPGPAARERPHSGRHARRGRPARRRADDPVGQPPVPGVVQPRQRHRRPVFRGPGHDRDRRPGRASAARRAADRPGQRARCSRRGDNRFFQLHAAPIIDPNDRSAAPGRLASRRDARNRSSSKSWPRFKTPAASWPT